MSSSSPSPTSEFKLLKSKRSQDQIADYLREEIYNGNLKPGEKLPANLELAAQWQTHGNTIQRAMEPLVKEGLLVRIPRVGTFVRAREEKLTSVGVYCTATEVKDSPYVHSVRAALVRELREAGIEMDLWTDTRPPDQQGKPWKALVKAAEQRRFQAFIGVEPNLPLLKWQQKLPVPTAFLAPGVPTGVTDVPEQLVEASLQELAKQGCRSVGLIYPINPEGGLNSDGSPTTWFAILEHFIAVAGDLNLQVKNNWMRTRSLMEETQQRRTHTQFGYEEFLNLWNQPEKPEGLVIFPADSVVTGALMAIQEKQVRVPDELKLVLHKNETIELFCPMPATFVVGSERDAARALIEQIQRQFRGESCEPISLPYKIVPHKNSDNN